MCSPAGGSRLLDELLRLFRSELERHLTQALRLQLALVQRHPQPSDECLSVQADQVPVADQINRVPFWRWLLGEPHPTQDEAMSAAHEVAGPPRVIDEIGRKEPRRAQAERVPVLGTRKDMRGALQEGPHDHLWLRRRFAEARTPRGCVKTLGQQLKLARLYQPISLAHWMGGPACELCRAINAA